MRPKPAGSRYVSPTILTTHQRVSSGLVSQSRSAPPLGAPSKCGRRRSGSRFGTRRADSQLKVSSGLTRNFVTFQHVEAMTLYGRTAGKVMDNFQFTVTRTAATLWCRHVSPWLSP